jgi:autoinducer 2-degrading protein
MYVVVVFFEAQRGHSASLRSALLIQARNSLEREPGCRQFDVAQDPLDENSFFLYEVYDSEAAFKAHLATQHFEQFNATVAPWTASKRVLTYDLITGHGQA